MLIDMDNKNTVKAVNDLDSLEGATLFSYQSRG